MTMSTEPSPDNRLAAVGIAVVAVFLALTIGSIFPSLQGAALLAGLTAFITLLLFYKQRQRAARLSFLKHKYGDESLVQRLMSQDFWQEQTAEQLVDSIGSPVAKDDNVLRRKKREVWKYNRNGINRYRLRITLEDDLVVGWNRNQMK